MKFPCRRTIFRDDLVVLGSVNIGDSLITHGPMGIVVRRHIVD